MAGRMILIQGTRESEFGSDDYVVYAMEKVIRERLAEGKSMFIEGPTYEPGRRSATLVIGPMTQALFSYTDAIDQEPTALIESIRHYVDMHGGFAFNDLDMPVEPS